MMDATGRFVGHIVDAVGFVWLAIGVDHRGISSSAGKAFLVAMPLFVAVPADNVGVAGVAVAGLTAVVGQAATILRWKLAVVKPKCSNLLNFLLG